MWGVAIYLARKGLFRLQAIGREYLGGFPEQLTGDWLAARNVVLDGDAPGTTYAVEGEVALDGGENGRISRAALVAIGGGGRARSVVVKRPSAAAAARGVAAVQRWYAREGHWYAALAASAPIRCPRCRTAPRGSAAQSTESFRRRCIGRCTTL